jgi:hypothetical protein
MDNSHNGEALPLPLLPDDGTIEQALVELDLKMSAWTGAMAEALTVIREAVVPDRECSLADGGKQEAIENDELTGAEALSISVHDVNMTDTAACSPADKTRVAERTAEYRAGADVDILTDSQVESEEEKALLASVAEPIAKRVRVRRRLNPQKNIQELIEECKASASKPAVEKPRKASWWRRKT